MKKRNGFLLILVLQVLWLFGQQNQVLRLVPYDSIESGAARLSNYLPLVRNKKVAVLVNHASLVEGQSLVAMLLDNGVHLVRIFSPEHGYKGDSGAGKKVTDGQDEHSGLSIVSLYGDHKKPTAADLQGIDILLIDLQDVGARFYTYISTMSLAMEACAENGVAVMVLDRPNPNGFYVDGPVLKRKYKSFVGMHPVPVVYGMTIGEYALMVNGEGWLEDSLKCDLKVIPLKHYTHRMIVKLPVKPSPNLPDWQAVYLYPSLCFFEGTAVSVGRGTDYPFQVYGHPDFPYADFSFKPVSTPGAALHPKWENKVCNGQYLVPFAENFANNPTQLHLQWLLDAYKKLADETDFFNNYFDKLAGTNVLREQIEQGKDEARIRESWKKELNAFKKIREKYLLYP